MRLLRDASRSYARPSILTLRDTNDVSRDAGLSSLNDPDADGVGDEAAIGHVANPIPPNSSVSKSV